MNSVDLWNEWEQGPFCNNETMPINSCDFCHLALLTETEQCMKGLSSSVWSSDSQDISEYINTITLKHQRNEAVIAIKSCGTQLFQQLTYALLVDPSRCAIQYWDCWGIRCKLVYSILNSVLQKAHETYNSKMVLEWQKKCLMLCIYT